MLKRRKSWSDWHKLHELDLKSIPAGPGAYIIATGRKLYRCVDCDTEGIVDIGESSRLRKRIRDFIRCATGEAESGHMAGWRYAYLGFHRQLPFHSLWVSWKSTETKELAQQLEARLFGKYVDSHFEMPPLNYKFNWL